MNRKLLFFDIDGTLLAGGIPGYIPDSTIEALKQAQANGHYIFINSGRTYGFMPEAIKEFPFDGFVAAVRKLFSTVRLFITMILMKI